MGFMQNERVWVSWFCSGLSVRKVSLSPMYLKPEQQIGHVLVELAYK